MFYIGTHKKEIVQHQNLESLSLMCARCEVNLSAFACYTLFHEDFSPIVRTNLGKLTSVICVHQALH